MMNFGLIQYMYFLEPMPLASMSFMLYMHLHIHLIAVQSKHLSFTL